MAEKDHDRKLIPVGMTLPEAYSISYSVILGNRMKLLEKEAQIFLISFIY